MSSSDTYYYDEGTYGPSHNHLHPRDYYPEHPHNGHHHHHDHDHRQHRLCCDKGKSFSWLGMLFCLLVVVAMMLVFAYKWLVLFLVGAFSLKGKSPTITVGSFFSAYNLTLNGPLFLQFLQSYKF